MLNIALVGAGWHSTSHHAPALRRVADEQPDAVRLAAVCDQDTGRAQDARQRFSFELAFTDIEVMLAEAAPDAAVIVLPVPLLLPVARLFLSRGIPVLLEKPLGRNLEEARAICEAAAGQHAMVSLNRRFDPGLRIALDWVSQQGPVRHIHGAMLRDSRTEPDFIWGTGIHLIDAACFAGGPLVICGAGGANQWRTARLGSPDGVQVVLDLLPTCGRTEERLRIAGEGFCVDVWTGSAHPWKVDAYSAGVLALHHEAPAHEPEFLRNGTYSETVAFLTALSSGMPPATATLADAMASSQLAAQLQQSSPSRTRR